MNQHLLIISQYIKWHACHIHSIIQVNETPKIKNILTSTTKIKDFVLATTHCQLVQSDVASWVHLGHATFKEPSSQKIHLFSKFLKPLLLYYATCKMKMLETVISFGLHAPNVSRTYHTQVVRYVNLALSPIPGRMKMVLEAISRN